MSKERPILFSAPMIRALLDGSKTQTRRVMKPQPEPRPDRPGDHWWPCNAFQTMLSVSEVSEPSAHGMAGDACPHGAHHDRLRVRETFFAFGRSETRYSEKKKRDEWHFVDMTVECGHAYQYAADAPDLPLAGGRGGALPGWHKRPAIFMPRAASRILLEIVSVRVERLNDCSETDARAEGLKSISKDGSLFKHGIPDRDGYPGTDNDGWPWREWEADPRMAYAKLWDQINGAGAWAANPWVWVISFKRVTP